MKSIDNRLSAVERSAARTKKVTVEYRNEEKKEMDLLQAVRLLLSGSVRVITRPWEPGEEEQYEDENIARVRKYMHELREKYNEEHQ